MAPPSCSGKQDFKTSITVFVLSKQRNVILTEFIFLFLFVTQNCVLGHNHCPYSGCQEAKRLHLHLKTCPANCAAVTKSEACPSCYNGCEQARQLLNHYRRCRGERARGGRKESSPHCLICSLVARQAKSMLGGGGGKMGRLSSSAGSSSSTSSMISVMTTTKDMTLSDAAMMSGPSPSCIHMPPPPPRRGILSHSSRIADASVLDARSSSSSHNKSISFADSRPRSSSVVESPKEIFVKRRSRSLSVGSSPTACETILEEEGSSSVDHHPSDMLG